MAKKKDKGSRATPALQLLVQAGVEHKVESFDASSAGHGEYGTQAAAALGLDPHRVFKTLVVDLGNRKLAVCVVPVSGKLSLKKAAAALGVHKATMAEPAAAERSSGYITGGISPLGQKTVLPTLVDASALTFDTIFFSAGRRGLDIEMNPRDIEKVLDVSFVDIAAG